MSRRASPAPIDEIAADPAAARALHDDEPPDVVLVPEVAWRAHELVQRMAADDVEHAPEWRFVLHHLQYRLRAHAAFLAEPGEDEDAEHVRAALERLDMALADMGVPWDDRRVELLKGAAACMRGVDQAMERARDALEAGVGRRAFKRLWVDVPNDPAAKADWYDRSAHLWLMAYRESRWQARVREVEARLREAEARLEAGRE